MLVSSVDYIARRIYLSADTVDTDIDTVLVYKEVRAIRRQTPEHQRFKPIIVAGGNVTKIPGLTYTPGYVILLYGCRIVPYDAAHKLRLIRDTFTDDGNAGRDCFDRTSLVNAVDIDVDFPEREIREVTVGGSSLTPADIWSYTNRTLTALNVDSIALAVEARLESSTTTHISIAEAVRAELLLELSRIDASISSRHASGALVPANIKQVNDVNITGVGSDANRWRAA
jgi:hypothetical protein